MRLLFLSAVLVMQIISGKNIIAQSLSANEVMEKTSQKLNSIKTLRYNYHRIDDYQSDGYRNELFAKTYLDYRDSANAIGFTFQAVDSNNIPLCVYNGTEEFSLSKKEKTMSVIHNASFDDMSAISYFLNSVVSLRKGLSLIIADNQIAKKLSDTVINGTNYYLLDLVLQDKRLGYYGNFFPMSVKIYFHYKIAVDKNSYLPLFIKSTWNAWKDYNETWFSAYDTSYMPEEKSWFYTTYENEYPQENKKPLDLITVNSVAPNWRLPVFGTDKLLDLNSLKGKIVLLDFWFKNCENCIIAVPELNALLKKYQGKNFVLIGVNPFDKNKDIQIFYEKHSPQFKTVRDDSSKIATQYGVSAYPTDIIIDETGKIIYAGGFDKEAVNEVLSTHVKNN